jgi:hypothetical protein
MPDRVTAKDIIRPSAKRSRLLQLKTVLPEVATSGRMPNYLFTPPNNYFTIPALSYSGGILQFLGFIRLFPR